MMNARMGFLPEEDALLVRGTHKSSLALSAIIYDRKSLPACIVTGGLFSTAIRAKRLQEDKTDDDKVARPKS